MERLIQVGLAEAGAVHIYVVDAETNQYLPKDRVTVRIIYFKYMGETYPLNTVLVPSKTTPPYWSFTSSLPTIYGIRVEAEGYLVMAGEVSLPVDFIQEYVFKVSPLSPIPPPPEEIPPVEGTVFLVLGALGLLYLFTR